VVISALEVGDSRLEAGKCLREESGTMRRDPCSGLRVCHAV
jgi:hypothetical protein